MSTTGSDSTAPRLRLSSARSTSSTAPPASTTRSATGMRDEAASATHGQSAISQIAACAFA
ncbi:hypothetical protein LRS13_08460 [Svornostia abyssi]|uniref:Uncharacterized protein n=1 Tax=Svornostia abyssi TaxID=2898438 RepID=A0ABY5PLH6_9ACTN|nr:hypothetical protein LRS13_08460 [Parviterribacteraceae bacterium J379]